MKAVVAGAGIGGLVSAIALKRAGIEVEIVEGASRLDEIGAGLSLWPNAMAALATLGLEEQVGSCGVELDVGAIRSRDGHPVYIWDRPTCTEFLGGVPVLIHRADLQAALLEASRGIPLRLGARVTAVEQLPDRCRVRLDSGDHQGADFVVGADGLRSTVRRSVEPSPARYSGLTSWRAVLDKPYPDGSSLWAAEGKQFLATALHGERTYISGLLRMPEGHNRSAPAWGPVLRRHFNGWDRVVTDAIDAIPEDGYFRDDIYFRPPPKTMVWGRVVLVGDAAHPVTPDLGQGGCQAIEDAVTLGLCLGRERDLDKALRSYQTHRLPRVRAVSRDSRLIGRVMSSKNPLVASSAIRRALLAWPRPMSPVARANLKQMARHASRHAFLDSMPREA